MTARAGVGRGLLRALDRTLVRYYGIFAFSDDPACMLRLSASRSRQALVLKDGTRILPGDSLLEIHFWNERLPTLDAEGATPAWGISVARRLRRSLVLLAKYLACTPRWEGVPALHAEIGFIEATEFPQLRRLVESLGFQFQADAPAGWRFWRSTFWENLYSWWMIWTFNPASLRGKRFAQMARCELWLSRATLLGRFCGGIKWQDSLRKG